MSEGATLGCKLGSLDGEAVGCKEGSSDGRLLGCKLASTDGRLLCCEFDLLGTALGRDSSSFLSESLGLLLLNRVGLLEEFGMSDLLGEALGSEK
jgi:hypothetical protein